MRFLLILTLMILVLIAGCGGGKSPVLLEDTTSLHEQLVAELNRQVSETWIPDMTPVIRFDEETRILFWCLRGDYDLSGEVNVSDITPIAQYCNQPTDAEVNPALIKSAPWWVDGDNSDQIAIGDVTPIAQNFLQRAFWWKTSIGWGQPLGGYAGMFYVLVPEDVDPETVVLKISSEPPPVETPENHSPIAILQATPNIGNAPLTVEFDASASIDLDGNITQYQFDWEGDGIYDFVSDTISTVSHTYPTVGSFHARLMVTDDDGTTSIDDQLVMVSEPGNLPPVAMLEVSPIIGTVPVTITLDASGSYDLDGDIITVEWDLEGDGTYDATSVGLDSTQPRQWPYITAGTYTPRIRVTDNKGAQAIAVGNTITLSNTSNVNQFLIANLTANPISGTTPLTVQFDASLSFDPDGDIVQYDYDFNNDGIWDAYDSNNIVSWTFYTAGTFNATVRITDNDGARNTDSLLITVNEPNMGVGQGDWWMFGREPTHNRRSPFMGPQTATLNWRYQTGSYVYACSPAISKDGTIYIGNYDGYLYAMNPDGSLQWQSDIGHEIRSSPAIGADGTIYIGSGDQLLYAVNPDGSIKWQFETGGKVESSPAIGADGTIYIGSLGGYLYAINPDGTLKWRNAAAGFISSSPAIGADETIYVGNRGSYICAVNPDGSLKWQYATGSGIYSSPSIGTDGTIYIGSGGDLDMYLYAMNPNGTLKWRYLTGGSGTTMTSSPAIGEDGTIYIGSDDHYLYAINPNGTLQWQYDMGYQIRSSPTIGADGTIYVGSEWTYLYAINPDGTRKWWYQTGGGVESSPSIGADGTLYVGSRDGYIYAFHD